MSDLQTKVVSGQDPMVPVSRDDVLAAAGEIRDEFEAAMSGQKDYARILKAYKRMETLDEAVLTPSGWKAENNAMARTLMKYGDVEPAERLASLSLDGLRTMAKDRIDLNGLMSDMTPEGIMGQTNNAVDEKTAGDVARYRRGEMKADDPAYGRISLTSDSLYAGAKLPEDARSTTRDMLSAGNRAYGALEQSFSGTKADSNVLVPAARVVTALNSMGVPVDQSSKLVRSFYDVSKRKNKDIQEADAIVVATQAMDLLVKKVAPDMWVSLGNDSNVTASMAATEAELSPLERANNLAAYSNRLRGVEASVRKLGLYSGSVGTAELTTYAEDLKYIAATESGLLGTTTDPNRLRDAHSRIEATMATAKEAVGWSADSGDFGTAIAAGPLVSGGAKNTAETTKRLVDNKTIKDTDAANVQTHLDTISTLAPKVKRGALLFNAPVGEIGQFPQATPVVNQSEAAAVAVKHRENTRLGVGTSYGSALEAVRAKVKGDSDEQKTLLATQQLRDFAGKFTSFGGLLDDDAARGAGSLVRDVRGTVGAIVSGRWSDSPKDIAYRAWSDGVTVMGIPAKAIMTSEEYATLQTEPGGYRKVKASMFRALEEGIIELDGTKPVLVPGSKSWSERKEGSKTTIPVRLGGGGTITRELEYNPTDPQSQAYINFVMAYGGNPRVIRDEASADAFLAKARANIAQADKDMTTYDASQESLQNTYGITAETLASASTGRAVRNGQGLISTAEASAVFGSVQAAGGPLAEQANSWQREAVATSEAAARRNEFVFQQTILSKFKSLGAAEQQQYALDLKRLELSNNSAGIAKDRSKLAQEIVAMAAEQETSVEAVLAQYRTAYDSLTVQP